MRHASRRGLRRRAAFTLLEVVAAGGVFALTTLGILSLLAVSMQLANYAKERTLAVAVVSSEIARLRAMDRDTFLGAYGPVFATSSTSTATSTAAGTTQGPSVTFHVEGLVPPDGETAVGALYLTPRDTNDFYAATSYTLQLQQRWKGVLGNHVVNTFMVVAPKDPYLVPVAWSAR